MPRKKDYGKWVEVSKKRKLPIKRSHCISVVVLVVLIVGVVYLLWSTTANNPPSTPSAPSGSDSGVVGTAYTYPISTIDPDGDQVKYTFDWGDGTTTDTTFVASGMSTNASHAWTAAGTYSVKARATDINGATSPWGTALVVTITIPPVTPSTPSGSDSGAASIFYTYSTSATDPDGDQIKYTFDWGDGTTIDTAFVDSGTSASASHSWSSAGTYSVKARTTDNNGATSSWSTVLTVTIASEGVDISKYGFESGTQGWRHQTWTDSQAITDVVLTTAPAKFGSKSLQCTVNLIGGHANNSKGEAWVNMQSNPPSGVSMPVDLSSATVSVWLYLPAEAVGDPSAPNGIQVFFKDSGWASKYSSWNNIGTDLSTDQWTQITVDVATEYWVHDEGCDLTQVTSLGVKIGAGDGSTDGFSGTFWIDAFDW